MVYEGEARPNGYSQDGDNEFDENNNLATAMLETLESLSLDLSSSERLERMESLVELTRQCDSQCNIPTSDFITHLVPFLSDYVSREERAAALKVLRHRIMNESDVEDFLDAHLDLLVIRCLARDQKHESEKLECIGWIRTVMQLPNGTRHLSHAVVRALVAIAEAQEDRFRFVALETLCELAVRDIDLLAFSEGLRVVFQALIDGPPEFAPAIASIFLFVVDCPSTRAYLTPGADFEAILAGFTDSNTKTLSQEDRLKASAKMVTAVIKSWSGLLYLCLNDKQSIESLIDSLRTPSLAVRETILDSLFEIFSIKPPPWYTSFLAGRRLTLYRHKPEKSEDSPTGTGPGTKGKINLLEHYKALLLLVFVDAGLIEALIAVAEDKKPPTVTRKVALLIGELLRLSNTVLPLNYGAKVQALPRLFDLATSFHDDEFRLVATAALHDVDSFNRNLARLQPVTPQSGGSSRNRSNSTQDPLKRGQRQVENAKIRMGMQIDDTGFRNLLVQSQVLSAKDHTRWSFDIVTQIFEGPLLNSDRLNEALRASKFVKNVLRFYHPFNQRYCDLKRTKHSVRWTKLGCTVLTTLLASPEGTRYLGTEDRLLKQLADALAQLDPLAGPAPVNCLFSQGRMEECLASGYFEMLGVLSRYSEGVRLMERFKLFTAFYHLSDLHSRDDIVKAIVENMDYEFDGHPRVILSKALTGSSKNIRHFATRHLSKLIRDAPAAREWEIRLLLTQLHDTSIEICELAVRTLEEACRSLPTLEIVVQMRPSLDHLGKIGAPLLLQFLSTQVGARYLQETGYIDREMESWYLEHNLSYVVQLEVLGSRPAWDGAILPHFYGELVKTKEGRGILLEKGHFADFCDFVRLHAAEEEDPFILARLKSVLWAMGHIGANPEGLAFLEEEDIIGFIVDIAQESTVYSLKGTAYFVLGLISSTADGAEVLAEHYWESVVNALGHPTGLVIPLALEDFVRSPLWEPPRFNFPESLRLPPPDGRIDAEILASIANLSNHMLAGKASKALAKLRSRQPWAFRDPSTYFRVLDMLADHHYRLPVRRYIMELFDVPFDATGQQAVVEAGRKLKSEAPTPVSQSASSKLSKRLNGMELTPDKRVSGESESEGEGDSTVPKVQLDPVLKIKGFLL